MDLGTYLWFWSLDQRLAAIESTLKTLVQEEAKIMSELDDLKAEVAQTTSVEASAVTLIQGIAAKLASAIASNDPAALVALKDQLNTETTALAAAVSANTPATP